MPELPDVEVFKRYLDRTALHRKVAEVEVETGKVLDHVSGKRLNRALRGRELERTRRHGKQLFVHAGDGDWLTLHFGMTGYLHYYDEEREEPDDHDRVVLHLDDGHALAFNCQRMFGRVGLTDDPDHFIEDRHLGPDALSLDLDQLGEIIGQRRTPVKSVLMNQRYLAGIGNVYSDEILYRAGIHPETPAAALDAGERKRLYRSMREVLEKAIEKRADPDALPRTYIIPQRHPGGRCPRCRTPLQKVSTGGRTGYLCPRHQKKKG